MATLTLNPAKSRRSRRATPVSAAVESETPVDAAVESETPVSAAVESETPVDAPVESETPVDVTIDASPFGAIVASLGTAVDAPVESETPAKVSRTRNEAVRDSWTVPETRVARLTRHVKPGSVTIERDGIEIGAYAGFPEAWRSLTAPSYKNNYKGQATEDLVSGNFTAIRKDLKAKGVFTLVGLDKVTTYVFRLAK